MSPRTRRAMLLFDSQRTIEAEAELRQALAEGDQSSEVHALIGQCLLRAGLIDQAREEAHQALLISPNNAFAHYALTFVQQSTLRFKKSLLLGRHPVDRDAADSYLLSAKQAVELEPRNLRYLCRLSQVHQILGESRKSLQVAEAALSIQPFNTNAAILCAEALTKLGRRKEARMMIDRALSSNPEAFLAHASMGWALLRAGDHRQAARFFEEALRLNASSPVAQNGALECAKHDYAIYRWGFLFNQWRENLPWWLRVPVTLMIIAGILVLLVAVFNLSDQWVRPVIGVNATALLMVAFVLVCLGLIIFRHPIFLWLVRRHQAAKLDANERKRAAIKTRLSVIAGALGIAVISHFAGPYFPRLNALFLGLLPGSLCFCMVHYARFIGREKFKWSLYTALVLIVGPLTAFAFLDSFHFMPGFLVVLLILIPLLPVNLGIKHYRQAEIGRRHQEALNQAVKKLSA